MFPHMKTLLKIYMGVLTYNSALKGERREVNMDKKKTFCLGFVALLLSMATVTMPVSGGVEPSPNALYVWPDSYTNFSELDTLRKGDMFTVDVMVKLEDGVLLKAWWYQLKWDSTNIELTNYTTNPPEEGIWILADSLGTDHHNASGSTLTTSVPCVTPRSIATYNFTVLETIYEPEPDEIGTLDLQDLILGLYDPLNQQIPHTVGDGQYRKCAISPLQGDINGDGIVNMQDIVIAALAFGSSVGEPNVIGEPYNPDADLNNDGIIDICDLVIIAINFGKIL